MNKISRAFKTLKILLVGWVIIVPLAYLIPRKKNLVLFAGKNDGLFFDNVKYLYLYLHQLKQNNITYSFFTCHKSVYNLLRQNNLPVLLHPSLRSIFSLVRANVFITCSEQWRKKFKYHLLIKAKKVQLWHGVPLKKIGLFMDSIIEGRNSPAGRLSSTIHGKNYYYDLCVTTSEYFTSRIFSKAVRAKKYIESGYPRNDILFKKQLVELDMIDADIETLKKIDELRKQGFKSVLYAPTWDDPLGNAVKSGYLNLEKLSEFAKNNKILFIFKFHPSVHCDTEFGQFDNIIYYDSVKDIQPLLRVTDILVTDYSSVYMDYLLLDRPVVFFAYNYEKYMESQQGLLFDYKSMAPGAICYLQDQLHEALKNIVNGRKDEFAQKREEVRNLAFNHKDGKAGERIWNYIIKEMIDTEM